MRDLEVAKGRCTRDCAADLMYGTQSDNIFEDFSETKA